MPKYKVEVTVEVKYPVFLYAPNEQAARTTALELAVYESLNTAYVPKRTATAKLAR